MVYRSRAQTLRLSSRIAVLIGAVVFAGGSVLVYTLPRADVQAEEPAPSPTPTFTPKEVQPSLKSRLARASATPTKAHHSPSTVPAPSTSPTKRPPTPHASPSATATPSLTTRPSPTRSTPPAATSPAATTDSTSRAQVIYLINQERTSRGLNSLASSSALSAQCQAWSESMAAVDVLSHSTNEYGGEIIASGASTAQQALDLWLNSPPHLDILLGSGYTRIGAGMADGYWTVEFE